MILARAVRVERELELLVPVELVACAGERVVAIGRVRASGWRRWADVTALLPTLTSVLAFLFALLLLDQWLERRQGFQAVWCFGMVCFGLGAGAEAVAAMNGWNEVVANVPSRLLSSST